MGVAWSQISRATDRAKVDAEGWIGADCVEVERNAARSIPEMARATSSLRQPAKHLKRRARSPTRTERLGRVSACAGHRHMPRASDQVPPSRRTRAAPRTSRSGLVVLATTMLDRIEPQLQLWATSLTALRKWLRTLRREMPSVRAMSAPSMPSIWFMARIVLVSGGMA